MRIITCAAAILTMLFAISTMAVAATYQVKKPGAQDGDSIITADGRHIRLICIDAPEIRQPHGKRAKQFLAKLIKNGITIKKRGSDQYGRTLAIVKITINGKRQTANEAMIRYGHAWVYKKYSNNCGIAKEKLIALETQAREEKRGLWKAQNPIPPWQWRYKNPRRSP